MPTAGPISSKENKLDNRQDAQLLSLRRMQIRSVAVGSAGALSFLIGLAWPWYVVAWVGLVIFTLALISIILFGVLAWWRFG